MRTHYIYLPEYEGYTLHNLSTDPDSLREFCEAFEIGAGERAVVEGTNGRVRLLENGGWRKMVTLIEHRKELSAQIQVLAHFEDATQGEARTRLHERRREEERRLQKREEREERKKQREIERAQGRNGNGHQKGSSYSW